MLHDGGTFHQPGIAFGIAFRLQGKGNTKYCPYLSCLEQLLVEPGSLLGCRCNCSSIQGMDFHYQ